MKKYKNIYFDLDRTLWDFDSNAQETFRDIYEKHDLEKIFNTFDNFYTTYVKHNERLWKIYRDGKIKKTVLAFKRFDLTLEEYGVKNEELAKIIGQDYIEISPTKKRLFPGTYETLDYLKDKYNLYIITNGFNEVQFTKLKNSKLQNYFKKVFTSENAGAQKPNARIFEHALKTVNARKKESVMVGDDLDSDILGAKKFGLDQVYFNPDHKEHSEEITHEISSLKELMEIL
ncbi:MAG: YjjG family noncanonical pyrimidine nucleotidase [Bacteroidales bacterium]|jgi:putative hydrolase of the HAD superfamily|nr:YjjG family noncanonical pyrimidine nucleotidase [Bacteroidales bacterium]